MSENLPDAPRPRRRRHATQQATQALAPQQGGALITQQEAAEAQSRIAVGHSFQRPWEEFPHWQAILGTVQTAFVERSKVNSQEADRLREPKAYIEFVAEIVDAHPEWDVQPLDRARLTELLRAYQFGYGPLEDYMRMDGLEEIYFNSPNEGFYIVHGVKHRITDQIFRDETHMVHFLRQVAHENSLEINRSKPNLDATLRDGSRLNATLEPIAYGGPDFVIRKHREIPFTIEDLIESGTLTLELADDLRRWIRSGMNIVISGGTASGKTTLMNTIGNYCIPRDDRILVLENRKELQIQTEDTKYFQTREDATREAGDKDITMKDLIRFCLRKRPDRIIVGEVRGVEAYYALRAWNSGHDGSMCTMHANSAPTAIKQLETYCASAGEMSVAAIRSMIADSVDIIVQISRKSGKRRVREVIQVLHEFKHEHLNPEVVERRNQLIQAGQIRALNDEIQVLPLYVQRGNELVKLNELLPVEGKS